jgi:hypothetical protein
MMKKPLKKAHDILLQQVLQTHKLILPQIPL